MENFKAKLIELPQIKNEKEEMVPLGKFTVGKKYRIYSVYTTNDFTDFLTADDDNVFQWINTAVFRSR